MNLEFLLPLAGYAFVASITPGPNNLMLMSSGANFGISRTIPHWLGVTLGFAILASAIGLGARQIFENYPWIKILFLILCSFYMLWLAWKIANAAPPQGHESTGKPLTFLQAALFQWINPKAIAMALTAVTIYAPNEAVGEVLMIVFVFSIVNFFAVGSWVTIGQQLRRFLQNSQSLRIFNITMALLLVATLWPILAHGFFE